jgi:hypothetical protein
MARPKLDDPTVPIAFRMKRSASEWWTERAESMDMTLPKLLRRVCEDRAERGQPIVVTNEPTSSGDPIPVQLVQVSSDRGCKHPINRRIGTGCGVCGKDPVK